MYPSSRFSHFAATNHNCRERRKPNDPFHRRRDDRARRFADQLATEFFAFAKPMSLVMFGTPDAEAKKGIAKLNPVYMTTFDSFTR